MTGIAAQQKGDPVGRLLIFQIKPYCPL